MQGSLLKNPTDLPAPIRPPLPFIVPKSALALFARLPTEYEAWLPYHSSRTRRNRPDPATLLVQSAASLQRFAFGSDAASDQFISLAGLWPAILLVAVI